MALLIATHTVTFVFMENKKKNQYFLVLKSAISETMIIGLDLWERHTLVRRVVFKHYTRISVIVD